jgi:hypothetical protein
LKRAGVLRASAPSRSAGADNGRTSEQPGAGVVVEVVGAAHTAE